MNRSPKILLVNLNWCGVHGHFMGCCNLSCNGHHPYEIHKQWREELDDCASLSVLKTRYILAVGGAGKDPVSSFNP